MLVKRTTKSIAALAKIEEKINLNPAWQRGPAWTSPRQVLLIDSILREMDFPKIYLRRLSGAGFTHDAVDGQQRLRAIFMFKKNELRLKYAEKPPLIGGVDVEGKNYSELPKKLRDKFDGFTVSIGEITVATRPEINELFARLQMGVSLNPAELRNAMQAPLRDLIDAAATAHDFFVESKIPDRRYKRQDYAAHAFAMAAYDGAKDIKANNLRDMVQEFDQARIPEVQQLNAKVEAALTVLSEVNRELQFKITQKWLFVDLAWLVMQWQAAGVAVDEKQLAKKFNDFDQMRRANTKHPDDLIRTVKGGPAPSPRDKRLYDYILAFQSQGATRANLATRNHALKMFCR